METHIYTNPDKLLQELLRFDTTNPPGNERECCMYIKKLLDDAGIKTTLYACNDNRPNLFAEIKSVNPVKKPLVMYGHIDVVPAGSGDWKHPPFAGVIEDGFIHGRGAADMKAGIAMFVCTMLKVKHEGIKLDFDLRLLVLSDEEDIGECGSKFITEAHPEIFENTACAFSEIGGFSLYMGGKKFYPIMITEKQVSTIKISFLGKGGHGSSRHSDTAMSKMARAVTALSTNRLKVRVTSEVSYMISEIANGLGGISKFLLKRLLNPNLTDAILNILKDSGVLFDNLLHNSVNITIVNGGTVINVIPDNVYIKADLRILPGCEIETALDDIRHVLNNKARITSGDYKIEVIDYDKNNFKPNLSNFESLRKTILELDPEGIPVPFVLSAVTDSRVFSKLGVTTYGFTPMRFPPDFDFASQAHNIDEKIPTGAVSFGVDALLLFFTKYFNGGN